MVFSSSVRLAFLDKVDDYDLESFCGQGRTHRESFKLWKQFFVLEEKKKLITPLFSGADEDGLLNLLVLDCFPWQRYKDRPFWDTE